jgi:hypothetical protein
MNQWKSLFIDLSTFFVDFSHFSGCMPASTDLRVEGIDQSTHDNDQTIDWTLSGHYMWSSQGNPDVNSDEWLLYRSSLCFGTYFSRTLHPLCIITSVFIEPMQSQLCYAPRQISFAVGCSADGAFLSSPLQTVRNEPVEQRFEALGAFLYGNHVRLDLLGRFQKVSLPFFHI